VIIAESRTFPAGPYTVRQQLRFDNPYWPQYVIFLGEVLIGKQFSIPNESDCEWLRRTNGVYATSSADLRQYTRRRAPA
jgi:hypothetical protein